MKKELSERDKGFNEGLAAATLIYAGLVGNAIAAQNRIRDLYRKAEPEVQAEASERTKRAM